MANFSDVAPSPFHISSPPNFLLLLDLRRPRQPAAVLPLAGALPIDAAFLPLSRLSIKRSSVLMEEEVLRVMLLNHTITSPLITKAL